MVMVTPPAAGVITDTTSPAPAGGGVAVATSWFEQLRNFVAQLAGSAVFAATTLASDTFTPTQAVHVLDTQGGAAADDLALIGQGSGVPDGWEIRIRCANAARVITVKHNTGGTGTIFLADAADLVLNDTTMWLDLERRGSAWYEIRRGYGGNKTALTAFLNAATAALKGIVELATTTETITGSDANRAVTPDSLAALWEDGGDLANGATITIGEGGSFNLITSTTTITAFSFSTSKAGRRVIVRFNTVRGITNSGSLVLPGGADITTAAGDICQVEDRGSGNVRVNWYQKADGRAVVSPSNVVRDWIAGLRMSNNTGTPNTKIDVAVGQAADSANAEMIDFAGGTLDLTTTGANGLRTGSLAANTNYAVFIIKGTSGVALFADTAITPGTRPSGYTASWRRIGVFRTDGSSHVLGFIQTGRRFTWKDISLVALAYSGSLTNGTPSTVTVPLPTGKKWPIICKGTAFTTVNNSGIRVWDPDTVDHVSFDISQNPLSDWSGNAAVGAANWTQSGQINVTTNTSSQIEIGTNNNGTAARLLLWEWEDDGLQ